MNEVNDFMEFLNFDIIQDGISNHIKEFSPPNNSYKIDDGRYITKYEENSKFIMFIEVTYNINKQSITTYKRNGSGSESFTEERFLYDEVKTKYTNKVSEFISIRMPRAWLEMKSSLEKNEFLKMFNKSLNYIIDVSKKYEFFNKVSNSYEPLIYNILNNFLSTIKEEYTVSDDFEHLGQSSNVGTTKQQTHIINALLGILDCQATNTDKAKFISFLTGKSEQNIRAALSDHQFNPRDREAIKNQFSKISLLNHPKLETAFD